MDPKKHDDFLARIAKTLYFGDTSSLDSVSLPLTELATELFNEVKKDNSLERLRVQEVAEIHDNTCVTTCSLVLAILYLEKIQSSNPEYVGKVAPSELFLVSLLIASKFLIDDGDDDAVTNYEWAVCSGMSLKTVNKIEKEFLDAINWEVYVTEYQFWSRLKRIEKFLASQAGKRRGWYSYTELDILMTGYEFAVFRNILKYSAICVTCYATTVFSLIGTAMLAIRVKHLFLNCILYVLMKDSAVIDDKSCTNTPTSPISFNSDSNLGSSETILNASLLHAPSSATNSSCTCSWDSASGNISAFELLSIDLEYESHHKLLKHVFEMKHHYLKFRTSLFHSRHGWPDF